MIIYKVTLMVRKVQINEEGNEYLTMPIMGDDVLSFYSQFALDHDWARSLPAEAVHNIILENVKLGLPELVGLMKVDARHE